MKKSNATVLIPLLALCAWVLVLFLSQQAGHLARAVSVRYDEGQGVCPTQIGRAEQYAVEDGKEDLLGLTAWVEKPGQLLSDEGGDRGASATVLSGYGSCDDMYRASFRFGTWPVRGDSEGIALDTKAANGLWGGTGAIGQVVRWEGNTYYLRGVFEGDAGLAVVQDGDDSEVLYPNLLLRMPDGGGADQASAFLNSAGMSGGTLLDLPFLAWLLTALAGLPCLLLAAALLVRLLRRGWRLRHSPLLLARYFPFALLGGLATLWAAGFPWDIPAKAIPTRLSDLDFWGRLGGEVGRGIVGVLTHSMSQRDLALWTPALFCLLALPITCALTLWALRWARAKSLNQLLVGGLLSMGATFLLTVVLTTQGGVKLGPAVWLVPVLWLSADLALSTHQNRLKPRHGEEEFDETPETHQTTLGAAGL